MLQFNRTLHKAFAVELIEEDGRKSENRSRKPELRTGSGIEHDVNANESAHEDDCEEESSGR